MSSKLASCTNFQGGAYEEKRREEKRSNIRLKSFFSTLAIMLVFLLSGMVAIAYSESIQNAQEKYSPEVKDLIETTYLGHAAEFPDPGEPATVLKKYLHTNGHKAKAPSKIELNSDIKEWEKMVENYPKSRHAFAGLARLIKQWQI